METRILKLFEKRDEGAMSNAIISYHKQEFELVIIDYEECVASYRYNITINLWLILLNFNWIKKT